MVSSCKTLNFVFSCLERLEIYLQKRIHKEIITMSNSPPPGTKLCVDRLDATGEFVVELIGAKETLYCSEQFKLLFKFGERYPFESPQVW